MRGRPGLSVVDAVFICGCGITQNYDHVFLEHRKHQWYGTGHRFGVVLRSVPFAVMSMVRLDESRDAIANESGGFCGDGVSCPTFQSQHGSRTYSGQGAECGSYPVVFGVMVHDGRRLGGGIQRGRCQSGRHMLIRNSLSMSSEAVASDDRNGRCLRPQFSFL